MRQIVFSPPGAVIFNIKNEVFTGLQSGLEYSGRVAAIGAYKQVKCSDVLSRIVL